MAQGTDEDQQNAFEAVQEQGKICLGRLQAMQAPNERIARHVREGDPTWMQMAALGYDGACRARAGRALDNDDSFLKALKESADLKLVCDTRWMLGEDVDVLRRRIDRLSTLPIYYDNFERCIRQSVTGPDRSPDDLAGGIDHALALGAAAIEWKPQPRVDGTLVQRWKTRLENNPIVAVLIIAVAVVTAVAGVYNLVPAELKQRWGLESTPAPASEAWAIAGSVVRGNPQLWSRANVDIVERSAASDRKFLVREGDIIEPRVKLDAWIVDFKTSGKSKLWRLPSSATIEAPTENQTGASFAAHGQFDVLSVTLATSRGPDDILWVRLKPHNP